MIPVKEYNQMETYFYKNFEPSTAQSYLYDVKRIYKAFLLPYRASRADIEAYLLQMKKEGKSASYRIAALSGIKALFDFYISINKVNHNPIRHLRISNNTKKKGIDRRILLTQEEMMGLLQIKEERYVNLTNRNKSLIGLCIYQGLSLAELVNLKVSDIDTTHWMVTIRKTRNTNERTLKLKSEQVLTLDKYLNIERPKLYKGSNQQLFVSIRNSPMSADGIQLFFRRLYGFYHKEISVKSIRRSVISYWVNERKIPIEDVQIMAGHKYPSSTEKYLQVDFGDGHEAITNLHNSIFN